MTDRPIIFSGPMVRALLAGRKTQTRRIAKITAIMGNKVAIESPDERLIALSDSEFRAGICHYESTGALSGPYSLPAAVGDRLWVREAFLPDPPRGFPPWDENHMSDVEWDGCGCPLDGVPMAFRDPSYCIYKCDEKWADDQDWKWRPSIHMPRWASRLTLTVTDVRVQRLQDMEGQHPSESDAIAEGVNKIHHGDGDYYYSAFRNEPHPKNWCDPTDAFRELWNSIHGPDAWAKNPWVAALTFTVERRNIDVVDSDGVKP